MAHRILIVDDSSFMRNIIKQIIAVDDELEVAGEAEDGLVALDKERELKPALILLDIEMPRLDGLGALKRLKLTSKAKVVVLSSVAQLGSAAALESRRLGAVDVIAKPSGAISLDLKAKRGHEILRSVRSALGLAPLERSDIARTAQLRKDERAPGTS
jgi:two-component system chemotaxis response regulator CheB